MRLFLLALIATTGACRGDAADGGFGARDHIAVVGSSTVFPFTATIAERFVDFVPGARAPVVESTGTGAGIRQFCGGLGAGSPDIADASRRMRPTEYASCAAHGVRDVLELEIGRDGLAFVAARRGPSLRLTPAAIYRALAATPGGRPNAARTWQDADPALPPVPIRVYGPPPTSGTRDALDDLVLTPGCAAADPAAAALARTAPAAHRARCTRLREDGAWADAGENDNLVVQKLRADPGAIGVLGYGYLAENADTVRGLPLAGVMPTYAAIADGRYPGARPLYLYVKAAHLAAVPGLAAFIRLYADALGRDGPLAPRGLIAAPAAVRARTAAVAARALPLDPATLG